MSTHSQSALGLATQAATPDPESAWQQILARDPNAAFLYGVATTGIFCRPACASRRPRQENVRYFASPSDALAAGFRPCQRCKPTADANAPVEAMRTHIEAHIDEPVSLADLGHIAQLSPFTAQRLFKRAMGVSPLQYQRALRAHKLRSALKDGESVTDATYSAGFSSPSRAHAGAALGMAPARFATGGRGEHIGYSTALSPFGWIIVGATERGLCWLALADSEPAAVQSLRAEFPAAVLESDPSLGSLVDAALACVRDGADLDQRHLDLRGTVFQLRVWQALRQIPRGTTKTYSQLARELGDPNATRAVARACATNRVAILVPCHRVVGVSGSLTGYRWGVERKQSLLAAEKE